jgi:4-alpha-glucanotransferase
MSGLPNARSSGILLHPTSLPNRFGIGDLGPSAYQWIERLARARQTWWQVLPLGPTGYGDSPYQCFSAFAGNPYLISPELLEREGLISNEILHNLSFPEDHVDYGPVIEFKLKLIRHAWERFRDGRAGHLRDRFEAFRNDQRAWLDDYALFMALKDAREGEPWYDWPRELQLPTESGTFSGFMRQELDFEVGLQQFAQFLFFSQWSSLRQFARDRGIRIIGDAPIFVASDSADVWGQPRQFLLDAALRPRAVAGVPPDYFSPTGQLWGNPLYDWESMRATGYRWWIDRMRASLQLVDLVRLDHFRGFCAAWHVPPHDNTAEHGKWVPGPGADFFDVLQRELGSLPLIAEDLGEITADVHELRHRYQLPGMKVLQFAFDKPSNAFLPHNFEPNYVVYTGTHDNDTTIGWHRTVNDHERWVIKRYFGEMDSKDIAIKLIESAWASVARIAIAPLQDILGLGTEARMNLPGRAQGNWQWRMKPDAFTDLQIDKLAELTDLYNRLPA